MGILVVLEEDLHLSLLEAAHAEALFSVIDNNREHLSEWLKFPGVTKTAADSLQFIESVRMRFARNEGYWLGIWKGKELTGSIGFLYIDRENGRTEIGYWLDKRCEGNGIVTKSITALINYAFHELQLNKIEIGVAEQNLKSRAIPEKLGFSKEGLIRDYELINGRYLNRIIYGLKADEW